MTEDQIKQHLALPTGDVVERDGKMYFEEKENGPLRLSRNLIQIIQEVNEHNGELVLDYFRVVRLSGFYYDEDDYYYIFHAAKEPFVTHASCVGMFHPLKGKLSDRDYESLVYVWNLNCQKEFHAK